MMDSQRVRKVRVLVIANLLACAAVLFALAAPRAVSNVELGDEWQCSKAAFVTTCRQAPNQ
ncbi:hypothetical protein [Bradyrhizobium sp. NAS96.2]|uniref:hypothetical protein n=1 Tax=Bradyrhizobium sp. NAS96.2 TaxID=1680160 RepID=UPI001160F39B|nr:hypothetical protein [Bradyrhizobium sp. NAS96.2]